MWISLKDRRLLFVHGKDAQTFLQGLLTQDITQEMSPSYAALLTPQGRFEADMFVVPVASGFLLDVSDHFFPSLVKKLTLFRLRSQVELTPWSSWGVFAWISPEPPKKTGFNHVFPDPRCEKMGSGDFLKRHTSMGRGALLVMKVGSLEP